jgi:membrane protease YdiL (CAAX protease family)
VRAGGVTSSCDSVPSRGSLTPVCIIVYLALHALWNQAVSGPYVFVYLRVAFLLGLAAVLISRGRTREIYTYFVGRFLPRERLAELALMLAVVVVLRLLAEWLHPFFISNPGQILGDCVVAPLNEEIVFRGVFLSILLQQMPQRPIGAILLSTLIFISVHGLLYKGAFDAGHMFSLFLLGCSLGWIFFRTRSVLCCVAAHSLWNAFAFVPILHVK